MKKKIKFKFMDRGDKYHSIFFQVNYCYTTSVWGDSKNHFSTILEDLKITGNTTTINLTIDLT